MTAVTTLLFNGSNIINRQKHTANWRRTAMTSVLQRMPQKVRIHNTRINCFAVLLVLPPDVFNPFWLRLFWPRFVVEKSNRTNPKQIRSDQISSAQIRCPPRCGINVLTLTRSGGDYSKEHGQYGMGWHQQFQNRPLHLQWSINFVATNVVHSINKKRKQNDGQSGFV